MTEALYCDISFVIAAIACCISVWRFSTLAGLCGGIFIGWLLLAVGSLAMFHLPLRLTDPPTVLVYFAASEYMIGWLPMALIASVAFFSRAIIFKVLRGFHHDRIV